MVKHVWSILCAKSSIDRTTNNISLFEVIEQLQIQAPPERLREAGFAAFPLEFISLWCREVADTPARGTGRVVILDPAGNELNSTTFDLDVTTHQRRRVISKLGGMPVRGNGQYLVRVQQQVDDETWTTVAEVPLDITVSERAPVAREAERVILPPPEIA
jgi:hypothetical protein